MGLLNSFFGIFDIWGGSHLICFLGMVLDFILFVRGLVFLSTLPIDNYYSQDPDLYIKFEVIFYYSILAIGVFDFLMNLTLMWGMMKGNKFILVPWLTSRIIYIVIGIPLVTVFGLKLISDGVILEGVSFYVFGFGALALCAYCFCCVMTLYQVFDDEKRLLRLHRKNLYIST